jgi:ADP-ribose pyrophosphatase
MTERLVSSRRAYEGKLINVRVDEVRLESGRMATREVVEHPGAVAILPWDGRRVALVRQWRHPTGRALLEVPAGTLDPGEAPMTTATRELAEECGLAAGQWEAGPSFFTAPGFCTELMHLYLATDLTDAPSAADDDESIEVEWLSLDEAMAAVEDGHIADAKSIAGILWLARRIGADVERP